MMRMMMTAVVGDNDDTDDDGDDGDGDHECHVD